MSRSAVDSFPPCAPACDLARLAEATQACEGCVRYLRATQAVFGEGSPHARLMLVGEVPGDDEDREGRPFVGPAGRLLDVLLEEAGIRREDAWLTNAVKHFSYEQRGARRIHVKPTWGQVMACRPWLDAEIDLVAPDVIVLLGSTAAQALLGRSFRISRQRGRRIEQDGRTLIPTWHPSAALRAPDHEARSRIRREVLDDLRQVAGAMRRG